jgi:hypothetical protein
MYRRFDGSSPLGNVLALTDSWEGPPMATTGTSRTGSRRSGGNRKQQTGSPQRRDTGRTATVTLPFVTATFRAPEMTLPPVRVPNRQDVDAAVQAVQPYLPSPQQAAYYGALAALATVELIEWPVALAIGAGSALVQRAQQGGQQRSGREAARETKTVATS